MPQDTPGATRAILIATAALIVFALVAHATTDSTIVDEPSASPRGPFGGIGGMGDGRDTAGTFFIRQDRFHPAAGAGGWAHSVPYGG